jgi:hypothetical protein
MPIPRTNPETGGYYASDGGTPLGDYSSGFSPSTLYAQGKDTMPDIGGAAKTGTSLASLIPGIGTVISTVGQIGGGILQYIMGNKALEKQEAQQNRMISLQIDEAEKNRRARASEVQAGKELQELQIGTTARLSEKALAHADEQEKYNRFITFVNGFNKSLSDMPNLGAELMSIQKARG